MSILVEDEPPARLSVAERVVARLSDLFGYLGGTAVALLMVHVVIDVTGRMFLNTPAPATLEVSQYWYMPLLVFCGLPLAARVHEHISAPIVFDRVSPKVQLEFTLIGSVITVAMLLAMAWFGLEEAMTLMRQGATGIASGIPIWPVRFIVPLATSLFAAQVVLHAIHAVAEYRTNSAAVDDSQKSASDRTNQPEESR